MSASLSAKYNGAEDYGVEKLLVCVCMCVCLCTYRLLLTVVFMWSDVQLQRSGGELVEGRSQLEAVLEQRHSGKDVQTQSGS